MYGIRKCNETVQYVDFIEFLILNISGIKKKKEQLS